MLTLNNNRIDSDRDAGRRLLYAGTDRDLPIALHTTSLEVPGAHGAWRTGLPATHQSRPARFAWELTGADREQVEERLGSLLALLSAPALHLGRTRGGAAQSVEAELASVAAPAWAMSGRSVRVEAILTVTGPFWREVGATVATVEPGTVQGVAGLAGSTAPVTDVVLRVPGSTAAFEVTNPDSGTGVSWTGPAGPGFLFVRAYDLRAWRNADPSAWSHEGPEVSAYVDRPAAGPLALWPRYGPGGSTSVYVRVTGAPVTIHARRAWL